MSVFVDWAMVYGATIAREDLCLKRIARGDHSGWCLLRANHVNGCAGPVGEPLAKTDWSPKKGK